MAPLRRWLKTFFKQHLTHRGGGDGDTQPLEFADDPLVAPVPVLLGGTKDQFAKRRL
jgi:hypothetical protein